jgi:hypothetical protein
VSDILCGCEDSVSRWYSKNRHWRIRKRYDYRIYSPIYTVLIHVHLETIAFVAPTLAVIQGVLW